MTIAIALALLLYSGVAGSIAMFADTPWLGLLYLPASIFAIWGMSEPNMHFISAGLLLIAFGVGWHRMNLRKSTL